jgi:hypothetical protein
MHLFFPQFGNCAARFRLSSSFGLEFFIQISPSMELCRASMQLCRTFCGLAAGFGLERE